MKLVDYFNPSLEEKTNSAWQKLRRKVATGMSLLMLTGVGMGMTNKPVDAYQHNSIKQGQKQSKKDSRYIIKPLNLMFYDLNGNPHKKPGYENLKEIPLIEKAVYLQYGWSVGIDAPIIVKDRFGNEDIYLDVLIRDQDTGEYLVNEITGRRAHSAKRIDPIAFRMKPGRIYDVIPVAEETAKVDERLIDWKKVNEIYSSVIMKIAVGETPRVVERKVPKYIYVEKEPKEKKIEEETRPSPAPAIKRIKETLVRVREKGVEEKIKEPSKVYLAARGAWIQGQKDYQLSEEFDPQEPFSGLFLTGELFHPNMHLWISYLQLKDNIQDIDMIGQVINKMFSQSSYGIGFSKGILMLELEGISAKNYFSTDYGQFNTYNFGYTNQLAESSYQGYFGNIGVLIPLSSDGKGFASSSYIQAGYGMGFGNVKYNYDDYLWNPLTIDSESITEKNFIKARFKTPYLDAVYSQSDGNNAEETLNQKRRGGDVVLKLPLSLISDKGILKNLQIIGYAGFTEIEDSNFEKFSAPRYGIGIGIDTKKK